MRTALIVGASLLALTAIALPAAAQSQERPTREPTTRKAMVFRLDGYVNLYGQNNSDYWSWTPFRMAYGYNSHEVVYTLDDFHYQDGEGWIDFFYDAPIRYAAGRVGNQAIPYHAATGSVGGGGFDPVGMGVWGYSDQYGMIRGSATNYQMSSLEFEREIPLSFDTSAFSYVTPDGTSYQTLLTRVRIEQAVPEPATWAMMLLGFGAIGAVARGRRDRRRAALC